MITGVLTREKQEIRVREGDIKIEIEFTEKRRCSTVRFEDGGRGCEPRNAGDL